MACYKLFKKDANLAELRSINITLGNTPGFYKELFKASLWSANGKIRPFQNFPNDQQQTKVTLITMSFSSLKVFYQNIGGMRTRQTGVFLAVL